MTSSKPGNTSRTRTTAVCIAKRHGSAPVTARFSVMDAKRAGLWTKAGPWQTYPRRMLQMRARSFALRDAFHDVLKGLISVEEALDNHSSADQLSPPTIDAIAEPPTPAPPPAPPRPYLLTTKQGTTTFQTGEDWLAAWAKLVRSCKAARALDKLQTARQTNQAHIAAVAAVAGAGKVCPKDGVPAGSLAAPEGIAPLQPVPHCFDRPGRCRVAANCGTIRSSSEWRSVPSRRRVASGGHCSCWRRLSWN